MMHLKYKIAPVDILINKDSKYERNEPIMNSIEEEECSNCGSFSCSGSWGDTCTEIDNEDDGDDGDDGDDECVCPYCEECDCPGAVTSKDCMQLHAWREGRRACKNKISISTNPYKKEKNYHNGHNGVVILACRWDDGYRNRNQPD